MIDAQYLVRRRVQCELSAAELARRTGISKGYLHKIEHGNQPDPSVSIVFRLAEALDASMYALLKDVQMEAAEGRGA